VNAVESTAPRSPRLREEPPAPARAPLRRRLYWTAHDSLVLTERTLRLTTRIPELLVFSIIQPVMFVLLFRYVFGGAIHIGNSVSYVNFLMAGIFVQTVAFGGVTTGVGLAHDLDSGLIDRYRSLPMSHFAVVLGRTAADLVRNVFTVVVMFAVGFAVGFRPLGSPTDWLAAAALLLLLSFTFSWIGACVGLAVRNVEAVQSAGFIWLLPLTFTSSAFVPSATMPNGIRQFSEAQPVSQIVDAVRAWTLGQPVGSHGAVAVAWCVGILVVFMPLAARLFKRAGGKV
jgi:ABC-2 type transport system permease protein/oleandomycin transport system permease protein